MNRGPAALAVRAAPARRAAPLAADLDRCERLLAFHLNEAIARFGAAALGVLDLPPITGGALSAAQLRVAAVLLWAKHVDLAGLLAFMDALAEGVTRGTLPLPLGGAARRLVDWHRGREERFGADERQGLFERTFGPDGEPVTNPIAGQLEALVSAFVDLAHAPVGRSTQHFQARINVIARDLAGMLSDRAVGMAAWAARDLVGQIRTALDILRDKEVAAALGGSPWTIVRDYAPDLLGRSVDPTPHLALASAGLRIVTWLAESAAALEQGTARVTPDDPVVSAALSWAIEKGSA